MKKLISLSVLLFTVSLFAGPVFDPFMSIDGFRTAISAAVANNTANIVSISTAGPDHVGDYVCTGTADQTVFATAIAAMKAGDTLMVYPGTYNFAATLTVNKAINIIGVDRTLSIISVAGNYDGISVTVSGVTFRYMGFATTAGQTQMKSLIDIAASCNGTVINNCYFAGQYDITINGFNAYTRVTENIFYLPVAPAGLTSAVHVAQSAGPSALVVEKNVFVNIHCLIYGEIYSSISTSSISDNIGSASSITINLLGGISSSVIRNNVLNSGNIGIKIIDQDHAASLSYKNSITGNTLSSPSLVAPTAIDLYGVTDSVIDGNKFNGYTTDCIKFSSTNYPVASTGNTISNSTLMGSAPSGGITEADSSQDYNKYVNNIAGTVTVLGAHSVNRDASSGGGLSARVVVDQTNTPYTLSAADNMKTLTNAGSTSDVVIQGLGVGLGNKFGVQIVNECGSALGGTITHDGDYNIHTFMSSGTFVVPSGITAEVLVVGGGGSGGYNWNGSGTGGGGAGGIQHNTSFSIPAGSYSVTVGAGGVRQTIDNTTGNTGADSIFMTMTANGGLGGLTYGAGGTGGASGAPTTFAGGGDGGYAGGGGAGAGLVGGTAVSSGNMAGHGGDGLTFTISGSSKIYGVGGGGGGVGGVGSTDGGGHGGGWAAPADVPTAGTPNTGNGGGGIYGPNAGGQPPASGPNGGMEGGSGIVIIRYLSSGFSSISIIPASGERLPLTSAADRKSVSREKGDCISYRTTDTGIIGTAVFPASTNWVDTAP